MDGIEVRQANVRDVDAVARYHQRCFATTFAAQLATGELSVPERDGTRRQLCEWFQPGSGFETLVAVVDGTPIGHVTVSGHQLVHLFVDPVHQGTGLGRHLLSLGEATIVAAGHNDLELHARVENTAAVAFYEKGGWMVTDRLIHTVEHGISYDEHVIVKRRV